MTEEGRKRNDRLFRFTMKALKATIKAIIVYGIYFILLSFLAPVSELVPGFQQTVETFVIVYILIMIIGELSAGTIYHHFFNAAKALFVIIYLIFSLKGGTVAMSLENFNLVADLRFFLIIAMFLSSIGLAKSVLQAIDFLNKKAEPLPIQVS
uniref:Uncharacterized protein n=1 Tax=uncultured marine crenarchaeote E48-1C TaxID=907718 RepID=G9BAU6_9ARCH|nr:hypothetical protein E48-1C_26 [uncultured marine crenarchaeote E48-1C]